MPPYALAPAHVTRVLTRAERVRVRLRAMIPQFKPCCQQGHLHRFGAGDLTGLQRVFAYGLYAGLGWRF